VVIGAEYVNAGRHVVQFYSHDAELADRVSDYLLGALEGGGVAIVIATAVRHQAPVVTSDPGDLTRIADSIGVKIRLFPT